MGEVLRLVLTILVLGSSVTAISSEIGHAGKVDDKSGYSEGLYAKVGDRYITIDEYNRTFQMVVREKFYHSKPPEGEIEALRLKVADDLIKRQLLLQEAARRDLVPDEVAIDKILEQYDKRYANSAQWMQQREVMLSKLKANLRNGDLLQQLERMVRNVTPPSDSVLKRYYLDHPEKFTEPMQQKLSLILLLVDPSSAKEVWDAALKEGQMLVQELKAGSDFSELARMHSGDVSASNGGDMGYVHREMLSEAAQKVVDELQPGDISDAIRVLQGVAILRLDERKPERLRDFNDVVDRARGLWMREKGDTEWADLQERLKLDTPITVYNTMKDQGNDV